MRVRASFWTAVAAAAIVFGAGLGGTWLGAQMEPRMPWLWGVFGAIVAGLALFGAVGLVVEGRWQGWLVLTVVSGATITMDLQFFASTDHDVVTALLLGVFPTLLAVAAGVVEVNAQDAERKRTNAEAQAQRLADAEARARTDADKQAQKRADADERAALRAHELALRRMELESASTMPTVLASNRHSASTDAIPCKYASAGCEQQFASVQSANAHARFCQHRKEVA